MTVGEHDLDSARQVPEKSSVIAKTKSFYKLLAKDRYGHFKIPSAIHRFLSPEELIQPMYNSSRAVCPEKMNKAS